jgi:Anti-anti-sigma regulatory factor (antagonist of anti-sigma factor)
MPYDAPTYERHERPGGRTLVLTGELDVACVADLRREFTALVDEVASEALVDLSGVTFFDSSSIGALLEGQQTATSCGKTLVLVSPSETCRRVLEIAGVAELFEVRDS